jgi:hypothetical protein
MTTTGASLHDTGRNKRMGSANYTYYYAHLQKVRK